MGVEHVAKEGEGAGVSGVDSDHSGEEVGVGRGKVVKDELRIGEVWERDGAKTKELEGGCDSIFDSFGFSYSFVGFLNVFFQFFCEF